MNQISEARKHGNIWKRLVYMILFMMIFGVAEFVLYLTAAVGFICRLFGKPINKRVRNIGHSIALYIKQIADYLSFNSETAPFPFDRWPDDTVPEVTVPEVINTNFD
jgi:hypothetical protein